MPTVVAGDVVVLGTGDVVPADLRLFEAKDFKARNFPFSADFCQVSEMALTGEPDDVAKTAKVKD